METSGTLKMPKGRIYTLRERPVKDFIDSDIGSLDLLTVTSDAPPEEVLKKIMNYENTEDAVIVVAHKSEVPALGVITHYDFLDWFRLASCEDLTEKYAQLKAKDLVKGSFFFVTENEPLQKAIDLMKEKNVTHVVVLNNKKERHFTGWVTRRSIMRKLGEELKAR